MKTEVMKKKLEYEQVEDMTEYMKFVEAYKGEYISWQDHLLHLYQKENLTEKETIKLFLRKTGTDIKTVKEWMRRAPTQRKYVVWIAICLRLTREETDRLLMRYAKFHQLYEKDPCDSILIFQLNNGLDSLNENETLKNQYAMLEKEYQKRFQDYQKQKIFGKGTTTSILSRQLARVKNIFELLTYFDVNMPSFSERNRKLTAYIDHWIAGRSLNELLNVLPNSQRSKLNQMVSHLRKGNKFPTRSSLIVLGLALTMPEANINALLQAGGFEPLCPKDVVEGAIICAVEDLYLNSPGYFADQPSSVVDEIKKHDSYFDELFSDDNTWDYMLDHDETLLDYVSRFMANMQLENDTMEKNLFL